MIEINRASQPHPAPPELEERLTFERDPQNRIVVAERLRSADPLIRDTAAALRTSKPRDGLFIPGIGHLDLAVSRDQIGRGLRILEALLAACRPRSYSVQCSKDRPLGTTVTVFNEPMKIRLREKIRRENHAVTKTEEALRKRGQGWSIPRYDYFPTGNLSLEIDVYADGARTRWADGKTRKLEELLNDVMAGMATISLAVLRPRRLEHERWKREQERRARRQAREEKRWRHLKATWEAWSNNRDLRAFLASVRQHAEHRWGAVPEGSTFARWFAWAEGLADRGDPFRTFLTDEPGRVRFEERGLYSGSTWEWEDDETEEA